MIAIFHSLPEIAEIKKNYLFFDEIQTSEQFLNSSLKLIAKLNYQDRLKVPVDNFKKELSFLIEMGIVKSKEDIESRLIPITGPFDPDTINSRFKNLSFLSNRGDIPLDEFFKNILLIQKEFGINIIGEQRVQEGGGGILGIAGSLGGGLTPRLVTDYRNDWFDSFFSGNPWSLIKFINEYSSLYSRMASRVLNGFFEDNNYFPLINHPSNLDWYKKKNNYNSKSDPNHSKATVVNLVINNIPIPSQDTTWQQLMEFKSDPDSKMKNLALRTWITDISKKELTPSEITDQIEGALEDYAAHMRFHKMKSDTSQFEIILTTTLEIFENLLKFKPSKVATTIFNLKRNTDSLFEEETKFPGRQLAYLHKLQQFL